MRTRKRKPRPKVKSHSLACPTCGASSSVLYARGKGDATLRVRTCVGPACGRKFSSLERAVGSESYTGVTLDDTGVSLLREVLKTIPPRIVPGV